MPSCVQGKLLEEKNFKKQIQVVTLRSNENGKCVSTLLSVVLKCS